MNSKRLEPATLPGRENSASYPDANPSKSKKLVSNEIIRDFPNPPLPHIQIVIQVLKLGFVHPILKSEKRKSRTLLGCNRIFMGSDPDLVSTMFGSANHAVSNNYK